MTNSAARAAAEARPFIGAVPVVSDYVGRPPALSVTVGEVLLVLRVESGHFVVARDQEVGAIPAIVCSNFTPRIEVSKRERRRDRDFG